MFSADLCCVFAGKVCTVVLCHFLRMNSDFDLMCGNVSIVCFSESISLMSTVANLMAGVCNVLRYTPLYPFDEYGSQYDPHRSACWFAMKPVGQTLAVAVGNEEHDTDLKGQ